MAVQEQDQKPITYKYEVAGSGTLQGISGDRSYHEYPLREVSLEGNVEPQEFVIRHTPNRWRRDQVTPARWTGGQLTIVHEQSGQHANIVSKEGVENMTPGANYPFRASQIVTDGQSEGIGAWVMLGPLGRRIAAKRLAKKLVPDFSAVSGTRIFRVLNREEQFAGKSPEATVTARLVRRGRIPSSAERTPQSK